MTLIFDIGKTNKKCFLFDEKFNVIEQEQTVFPEIKDEDGFFCDDLQQLTSWILEKYRLYLKKYKLTAVNFSTYGASLVHLDKDEKPLSPLYNYLKPFDKRLKDDFIKNYGPVEKFEIETASPFMGFLNSGLQLYWLKERKSEIYKKLNKSLHFPQYCSFLLSGKAFSDYTSLGCHTALWDFKHKNYHSWVYREDLVSKLSPVVKATHFESIQKLKIGVGIHDSSAALVPYLAGVEERFMVISTGTWSIVLNPFSDELLSSDDLKKDCLQFMQIDGGPVRASRLFLGKEHELQTKKLSGYFLKDPEYYKGIKFDEILYRKLKKMNLNIFNFTELDNFRQGRTDLTLFDDYKTAYHQLIFELVKRQVISFKLALGKSKNIETVFIVGGFGKNELYCKMLSDYLPQFQFKKANLSSGSALGAAIVINKDKFKTGIFEKVLKIEKI